VRIDYAIIGLSIVFLVGSMYLAGLSLQIADLSTKVQTVTYATYLFSSSIALLIFMAIISLIKKAILKPT
jgi:predicted anti-sigma-YlaC factor YlaD